MYSIFMLGESTNALDGWFLVSREHPELAIKRKRAYTDFNQRHGFSTFVFGYLIFSTTNSFLPRCRILVLFNSSVKMFSFEL